MSNAARLLWVGLQSTAIWCATPAAPMLNLRLETHLTSYATRARSQFRATVISPLELDGHVVIPPGSVLHGVVLRAAPVGVGLVRERAALDLQFSEYELPDGRRFPIEARLKSVDNAREEVTREGRVKGVLAAGSPQAWMQGVWRRPSSNLVPRSLVGLTGASGRVWTRYALGPVGAAALFATRIVMFRMPEPEIHLPPGTEMQLSVTRLPPDAPTFGPLRVAEVPAAWASWLAMQPHEVTKPGRKPAADIINLAFLGSRDQLVEAFSAAGWFPAEPLTPRSFSRAYRAYTAMRGYPTAPVSKLHYRGVEPDFVFQKSLNTITKRHHIRIWRVDAAAGGEVWLGAGTHDTGIAFHPRKLTISHRIDSFIDLERTKVADDLVFAGCSDPAAYLERPGLARPLDAKGGIVTDGRLAVLSLRACAAPRDDNIDAPPRRAGSRPTRLTRRVTLETRHYLVRGNPYYWGYRVWRWKRPETNAPTTGE